MIRSLDELRPHPRSDVVPPMDPDDYDAFVADVAARGITTPVDILADGTILDGRHRLTTARALGLSDIPVRVVAPADPYDYMLRAALLRRHLTTAQRKGLAAELLRATPERSDNGIAKTVGLHNETVAAVRAAMEEAGVLTESVSRIGTNGVAKPAHRPQAVSPDTGDDRWSALDGLVKSLRGLKAAPATEVAAAVPERRRAGTARTLRDLGTYLGSIALVLEEMA